MQTDIDRINLRAMGAPDVVAHYARATALQAHERAAIDTVAASMQGRTILDIGVGGGRTVPHLLEISGDYLGIDYSLAMVEACRERFPAQRFLHADARSMSSVDDNSIDLAVFSCNGLCMVGHDDRLQIMREIFRVLAPGGAFVFSTYNRNSPEAKAGYQFPDFSWSKSPVRLAIRATRFVRDAVTSAANRRRHVGHEVDATDFAVLNDRCHNYSVMLYYITLAKQRQQLESMGFAPGAQVFDLLGRPITSDTSFDSMAVVARKHGPARSGKSARAGRS